MLAKAWMGLLGTTLPTSLRYRSGLQILEYRQWLRKCEFPPHRVQVLGKDHDLAFVYLKTGITNQQ